MYHYVYQTTNVLNGKIYIGKHSAKSLDDGYKGSGKHLNHARKKHGEENFKVEILKFFDTSEDAFEYEKLLVNEEFIKRKDTYNSQLGGHGGWDHINTKPMSDETRKKLSDRKKGKVPKANARIVKCPHCDKEGQEANMKRWHFDNCGKPRNIKINKTEIMKCPHCSKEGTNIGSMKRHHFDNCKYKV